MLHVIQVIDGLGVGGAEKLMLTLTREARRYDIQLAVICLNRDFGHAFSDEIKALGVPIHFFPARKMLDVSRIRHIVCVLRSQQVDVVNTHLSYANIVGTLAGRLAGVPVVATLHNTQADKQKRFYRIRHWLEALTLRFGAKRIVAVGDAVAAAHQSRMFRKPIDVIPNAVDPIPGISPTERSALRTELVGDAERPLLISIGSLTEQKGYPDLLTAFAAVNKSHPSTALVIAGDGENYVKLAEQIVDLGLQEHAFLLGMRDDVPRLLAASDIFISASHWEGLPVAILEAMAAGLPIVATSVGDIPKVVISETGLVVPSRDPVNLSSAICSMLDDLDKTRRMGAAARMHVTRHYSSAAWFDKLLELYNDTARKIKLASH